MQLVPVVVPVLACVTCTRPNNHANTQHAAPQAARRPQRWNAGRAFVFKLVDGALKACYLVT